MCGVRANILDAAARPFKLKNPHGYDVGSVDAAGPLTTRVGATN
jgi:hypothetical protein